MPNKSWYIMEDKMKAVTLIAGVLIVGASGYLIKVPTGTSKPQPRTGSGAGWLHIQKLILPFFDNVCEISVNPIIVRLAEEFEPNGTYTKPDVTTNFNNLRTKGLLPKGQIFSEYNPDHLNELKIIFDTLYYAKDFDTFFKTAAWARQNINCGLFIDAIYLAILKRQDTKHIYIPPPFEVLPNYFVKKDIIFLASSLLAENEEEVIPTDNLRYEGNTYIISANYTFDYNEENESTFAYFLEDIGLNTFFYLGKMYNLPWFTTINTRYGEYLFHILKQMQVRYDLERYSNGYLEVQTLSSDFSSVEPSYDSMLIYSNGNEFSIRDENTKPSDKEITLMLNNFKNNISQVVLEMQQTGYNKMQIMNNIMEILVKREESFMNIARKLFTKEELTIGYTSVLDHYMTSIRDPIFWNIIKTVVSIVNDEMSSFPVYTKSELLFPGVEIISADVKKMMTSFEYFQLDVTDSLKTSIKNSTFNVKIEMPRLTHKPFIVKLNISAYVAQRAFVKVYIGPKTLPGEFFSKKNMFMLLDSFETNLKLGTNIISRSSDEIKNLSKDFLSLRTLYKKITDEEFGINTLPPNNIESYLGIPSRLIVPKGSSDGLPMQIFVFVAPFVKASSSGIIEYNSAILSPCYPLDLISDNEIVDLPNSLLKDIVITHKSDSKSSNYANGKTYKKWGQSEQSNTEDGTFTNLENSDNIFEHTYKSYDDSKLTTFDYESKKNQYGKLKSTASQDYSTMNNLPSLSYSINNHIVQKSLDADVVSDNKDKKTIPHILKLPFESNLVNDQSKPNFEYTPQKGKNINYENFVGKRYVYDTNIEPDTTESKLTSNKMLKYEMIKDIQLNDVSEVGLIISADRSSYGEPLKTDDNFSFPKALKLFLPNKRLSVYDYLLPVLVTDEDNIDVKVYE